MKQLTFKKTLIFSLFGHLTVFTVFGFSFGMKIPQSNYAEVAFWGSILKNYDFLSPQGAVRPRLMKFFSPTIHQEAGIQTDYLKPACELALGGQKQVYAPRPALKPALIHKRESQIMLHPALPYYFNLYFKDRQMVHIELMFKLIPHGRTNSIVVKRKIASGNLEVDLLSMRYISHYLFIQQLRLAPDIWQTVKIDFSAP